MHAKGTCACQCTRQGFDEILGKFKKCLEGGRDLKA